MLPNRNMRNGLYHSSESEPEYSEPNEVEASPSFPELLPNKVAELFEMAITCAVFIFTIPNVGFTYSLFIYIIIRS